MQPQMEQTMLKSLYIVFAGIPLVVSSLAATGVAIPKLPEPTKECPCSKNRSLPNMTMEEMKANLSTKSTPTASMPVCPDGLDTLCALTGQSMDTYCMAGGLFATCENPGTDNDGDGIYGEAHFQMKRYINTYHCSAPAPAGKDWVVCGEWMHMKIGGGTSNQDVCCATAASPPACPAGSCQLAQ